MNKKVVLEFKHPFIEGLEHVPEHKKKELHKIRHWMNSQPHLPHISDEYIYLFLHASYYSMDKTKDCIEKYFTVRANSPMLFEDRDAKSDRMQTIRNLAFLLHLPKSTPEGYKVLMYGVRDPDPTKFVFADAIKGFCMFNDCVISEDGLAEGYVVIFDMKGVQIGHLARVNLPALRAFMAYIQEAHPCRLRAVHIVNTASWIHHIMRIIVPLLKSELASIVHFHKGYVPEGFPQEILPEEYGGEAPPMQELNSKVDSLIDKYTDWLRESVYFRADESKRVKKTTWWGLFNGSNSTEKLDEKTILQNLQID